MIRKGRGNDLLRWGSVADVLFAHHLTPDVSPFPAWCLSSHLREEREKEQEEKLSEEMSPLRPLPPASFVTLLTPAIAGRHEDL